MFLHSSLNAKMPTSFLVFWVFFLFFKAFEAIMLISVAVTMTDVALILVHPRSRFFAVVCLGNLQQSLLTCVGTEMTTFSTVLLTEKTGDWSFSRLINEIFSTR